MNSRPAFLQLPFRPLFFFASLFSIGAMTLWLLVLQGALALSPYGGIVLWHGHEMLFGFVAAIVAGFLLTAVQNWTGIKGLSGTPLLILFMAWLAPRIGLLLMPDLPGLALLDLLFLPLATFFLARPIIAVRQMRNLVFVPVLLTMTLANVIFHLGIQNQDPLQSQQGLHLMIWLVVLIMSLLAGRVIPFFTANGTRTQRTADWPALEKTVVAGTLIVALLNGTGAASLLPDHLNGVLLLLAGSLHLVRFVRWRFWITAPTPLLWSLHAAYAFIPLGLILLGLSHWLTSLTGTTALHALLVGAMGSMILSMMARVSLGHTGKPLQAHPLMSLAFAGILTAGLLRSVGLWLFPQAGSLLLVLAGTGWILSYSFFIWFYWPILSRPRSDGKPG